MGKSVTVHCIGLGPDEKTEEGRIRNRMYDAMNRVEIVQQIEKARKKGECILSWYAQTRTGERILGLESWETRKLTSELRLPELVTCPICRGEGGWPGVTKGLRHFCVVCNGSGICKKGNEKHWQAWQLESMRKEVKGGVKW